MLGKLASSPFFQKSDSLYIAQRYYQALRYSNVYINESCQAASIFNPLDI